MSAETQSESTKRRIKNRPKTINLILSAVNDVIGEVGMEKAGISKVSERAGVNKVLIYRYFGGWNGLIESYVRQALAPIQLSITSQKPRQFTEGRQENLVDFLVRIYQTITENPGLLEIFKWRLQHAETHLARQILDQYTQTCQLFGRYTFGNDANFLFVCQLLLDGLFATVISTAPTISNRSQMMVSIQGIARLVILPLTQDSLSNPARKTGEGNE